jgi:hypothetical protein
LRGTSCGECIGAHLNVVERMSYARDLLVGLMPLARDKDDVCITRKRDSGVNRPSSVELDPRRAPSR